MKPSDETIEEFRKNYLTEFGEEISREEACERFLNLVYLLKAILYPRYKKGRNPESDTPSFPTVDQNPKNM
ncbi:MAG: hypothetical protein WC297_02490 [Candidatus Paceibacterota bacterium]|jgi:hypothetical protein